MKKYILIAIVALASTNLHAQETKLTLEAIPGKLAEQLTQEQMETVTELTLTGEMYNCDFYTIRDKMKVLELLDLGNALADSIPTNALATMNKLKHIKMSSILEYISFGAFPSCLTSITWISYPQNIAELAFNNCSKLCQYYVSENNLKYESRNGILFSKDRKKLVAFPPAKAIKEQTYIIPDGIEEIGNAAFMDAFLNNVELPESVNHIGNYAFCVFAAIATGGNEGHALTQLTCNNPQPPTLGNKPFHYQHHTILTIPENSKDLYAQTPIWNKFQIDGASINNPASSKLNYWIENDNLYIQSNIPILQIDLIDINGNIFNTYYNIDKTEIISIPNKWSQNIVLIKALHENKTVDVIKLIN